MERLGRTLEDYVNEVKPRVDFEERLRRVFLQMLDIVEMLHERTRQVHCDIKPSNFMMRGDQVVICDFGCLTEFEKTNDEGLVMHI
jgi:serine/threonine protein kinase